jgi:hypothetical protein
MPNNTCIAIIKSGMVCGSKCKDMLRCKIHERIYQEDGKFETERNEIIYLSKNIFERVFNIQIANLVDLDLLNDVLVTQIVEMFNQQMKRINDDYVFKLEESYNEERAEILERNRNATDRIQFEHEILGLNMVKNSFNAKMYNEYRKRFNRFQTIIRTRRHNMRILEHQAQRVIIHQQVAQLGGGVRINVRMHERNMEQVVHEDAAHLGANIPVERNLRQFVNDAQNVHTNEAVKQTKEIIEKIRKVFVPEEYRWHKTNSSKTPFEIGLECKLSQKAAWQMVSQYAQDTAIYDIEEGIYGKVLDSVWQYIKTSSEKEELCRVLKQEMEDNIGMCAQGNLSRTCNILAGYMEGINSQESVVEKLGRLLPPLLQIPVLWTRLHTAFQILREHNIPKEEWEAWTDPLLDDIVDETDYKQWQHEILVETNNI